MHNKEVNPGQWLTPKDASSLDLSAAWLMPEAATATANVLFWKRYRESSPGTLHSTGLVFVNSTYMASIIPASLGASPLARVEGHTSSVWTLAVTFCRSRYCLVGRIHF